MISVGVSYFDINLLNVNSVSKLNKKDNRAKYFRSKHIISQRFPDLGQKLHFGNGEKKTLVKNDPESNNESLMADSSIGLRKTF